MTLMPDLRPNNGVQLTRNDKIPTTIPYMDLLAKMANDPTVQFIDEDVDAGDEDVQWITHQSDGDLYEGEDY